MSSRADDRTGLELDASDSVPDLHPGDVVAHSAFGEGVVVSLSALGDTADVRFGQFGEKRVRVTPPHDRFLRAINGTPYMPRSDGQPPRGPAARRAVLPQPTLNGSDAGSVGIFTDGNSSNSARPLRPSHQVPLSARFCGALYYMAPLENLHSILTRGLLSKNRLIRENIAHESIALEAVQGLRHRIFVVDQARRLNLHDYVPLYFVTHNPMLAFRRDRQDDIVYIEIASTVLDASGVVFSDGNASRQGLHKDGTETVDVYVGHGADECRRRYAPLWTRPTRRPVSNLYGGPSGLDGLPWDAIRATSWANDDELKRQKSAETLVPLGITATHFRAIHVRTGRALRRAQDSVAHASVAITVRLSPELYFADARAWYDSDGDAIQPIPPWNQEFEEAAWAATLARAQDEEATDPHVFDGSEYAF